MKLYLVCKPELISMGIDVFLDDESLKWQRSPEASTGEELSELAGRICYMSFSNKQTSSNGEFIANLINRGHDSVLEHATWSFIVTGVTRSFTHQLVRHRIGFAYSQMSQQYNDQRLANFIEHPELAKHTELKSEWNKALQTVRDTYLKITTAMEEEHKHELQGRNKHVKNEVRRLIRSAARSILPNCSESKILFSANGRSLRHLLALRGSITGDLEMRIFSSKLLLILKEEAPSFFSDFTSEIHADGYPVVKKRTEILFEG
jgi:thymidylate synthase (FAD)